MKKIKSILSVLMAATIVLLTGMSVEAAPIDTGKAVTFTIHKYDDEVITDSTAGEEAAAGALTGLQPLANVQFRVSKTNLSQDPGAATTFPTAAAVVANKSLYGVGSGTVITTNASGEATTTIAAANQGIYLVEEILNPAIDNATSSDNLGEPFLVSLPMTNADGDDWNYNVHAYPKNKVKDGPEVRKEIDEADLVNKGVNVGNDVTWRIVSEIPADLYYVAEGNSKVYAQKFEITDALSKGLTYKNISFKTIKGTAEADLTLTGLDYTLTKTPNQNEGPVTLKFVLTDSGKEKVQATGADKLVIGITTTINSSALTVDSITNEATLDYTNSLGVDYTKKTQDGTNPTDPKPEVHTGSTGFIKYSSKTGATLKGAKFAIADTEANAKAGRYIKKDSTGKIIFYGEPGYAAATVYEVESNNSGVVQFQGLKFGGDAESSTNYYVMETFAPKGYQLLKNPIVVKVSKNSDLSATTSNTKVYNNEKFILPKTGGTGTVLFSVAGILLMGAAIVIIGKSKKRKA